LGELEQRVDRLESRQALSDLAAAYCIAIDERDLTTLVSLFTPDAGFNDLLGSEAIGLFFARWMAEHGPSFHSPDSQLVTFVSDEEATGVVTGHAEQKQGDVVWVMGMRYVDRYRRESGRWRIAQREVGYRYRARADQYPHQFGEVHR
jgi:hypothetical protein